MDKINNLCDIVEEFISDNEDKNVEFIRKLINDNEFPCKRIFESEFKNLKAYNFDLIKIKSNLNCPSCDILIIFKEFILLVEFKNPFYDKSINKDDREIEKYLEEIIKNKYLPVIDGSIKVLKSLFNSENINKILWIGFLLSFTEEFLNNINRLKKLSRLASSKAQYDLILDIKKKLKEILEDKINEIKKDKNLYELSVWECSEFINPFFIHFKKNILCPEYKD